MGNAEGIGQIRVAGEQVGAIKANRRADLQEQLPASQLKQDIYEQTGGCIKPRPVPGLGGISLFRTPQEEARELLDPVLNTRGAERMAAYQRFQEKLRCTSTAGLEEALQMLETGDLLDKPWINSFLPRDPDGQQVRNLLRRDIEAELANRPRPVKDEAVDLIDDVADKQGAAQMEAFSKFMDKVRGASRKTLEATRDELIGRMVNDSDRDRRLIDKLMLHAVNRELDRQHIATGPFFPGHHIQPFDAPLQVKPLLLGQEDFTLLNSKLQGADAHTAARIKALVEQQ